MRVTVTSHEKPERFASYFCNCSGCFDTPGPRRHYGTGMGNCHMRGVAHCIELGGILSRSLAKFLNIHIGFPETTDSVYPRSRFCRSVTQGMQSIDLMVVFSSTIHAQLHDLLGHQLIFIGNCGGCTENLPASLCNTQASFLDAEIERPCLIGVTSTMPCAVVIPRHCLTGEGLPYARSPVCRSAQSFKACS